MSAYKYVQHNHPLRTIKEWVKGTAVISGPSFCLLSGPFSQSTDDQHRGSFINTLWFKSTEIATQSLYKCLKALISLFIG